MKTEFSSRLGLIAATVGSAVGLGNIWRFPAETQENGGGAFLLVYIICVFLLGIPMMMAEFSIGRAGRTDAVGSFHRLAPGKKWWLIGIIGIVASYTVLSFYMVVSGWTLEYFFQSLTGNLYTQVDGVAAGSESFKAHMNDYVLTDWNPILFTAIMLVINIAILLGGVRKGIERIANILMPLLFLLLIVFAVVSLSLPNASQGVEYFLAPDFSSITPRVVINALGQAFFSLSLGLGALITYGSYFPAKVKLGPTACTVALLDMLVAILMGLIIFPAVVSFNLTDEAMAGTTLIFVTLPEVFTHLPLPRLWSSLFFLSLCVAAITSTVSLGEVTISLLIDRFKMKRRTATFAAMVPLFILSMACSLSMTGVDRLSIGGMNLFDFFDNLSTNILLPAGTLLVCIFLRLGVPREFLQREFSNNGTIKAVYNRAAAFSVHYIAPWLILLILISPLL